jgi:hypothetical protein
MMRVTAMTAQRLTSVLLMCLVIGGVLTATVEAGWQSPVVTVPVVAVFHDAEAVQSEVLPAVFIQIERRDDQEPLRVLLRHRPGMVEASYPALLESALRNGLARLNQDPRGLTVTIGFAGRFRFVGGSLSAAVVIGAVAALEGRTLAPNLVLTGTVEADGSIGAIADLDAKITGAGAYTVLYPSVQVASISAPLHSRPVHSLQEARLLMLQ